MQRRMVGGEIGNYFAPLAEGRGDGFEFGHIDFGHVGLGGRAHSSVKVNLVGGDTLYQAFDGGNVLGISIQTADEQNFQPYQSCKFVSERCESRYQLFYANIGMWAVNFAESILVGCIERRQYDVGLCRIRPDILSIE